MMVLMTETGKTERESGGMVRCKDRELGLDISSIFTDCISGSLDAKQFSSSWWTPTVFYNLLTTQF